MQGHFRSMTWLVGALILGSLALAQPGRSATNSVTDVHYGNVDGAFQVTVTANGAVSTRVQKFSVDSKSNVQDLVVDVSPASYDGRTKVIGFSNGPIRQVRVGQLSESPAVMRIVVESQGTARYDLNQRNGERSVTLALATSQQGHALDAVAAAAAARAAAARQTEALNASSTHNTVAAAQPAQQSAAVNPAPAKPAPTKPVPAPVVAVKPAPEPVTIAAATPNPWLPGGKYYCTMLGRRILGQSSHPSSHGGVGPSVSGPSLPALPPGGSTNAMRPAGTVSIDVKNGDLVDVIRLLAQQSGQNIVTTPSVKGTVTISLHDVPLRQALDLIVRTNGLEYRQVGNVYVIGTPAELAAQFGNAGQVSQTVAFPIRYASPADLTKQLPGVLPAGSFVIDTRTDTLLVNGTPDVIQSARNFLALSDVPAPQVVFEVKVIDITKNNDSQNVGIDWTGQTRFGLFENCISCPGIPNLDSPPITSGNAIPVVPFTRNALYFFARINYMISHNQASLLADPRVEALDNQQAQILVGQTYPIVYYDSRAGQFQVQYIDIGVILRVTPVINTDGYITTTLHVERSVIAGLVQNQYPILNNRKIDDILRVKDGDTIVLGGLVDDETTKTLTKVPLLGDIPLVGSLFRNVNNTKFHNEVVFLITPHIVAERQ
jgi:type IV pilus assembly protein PilQ